VESYPMTASGKIQKYKLRESAPALLHERGVEIA
jgi:acyl-coenzyme A synthetase/AMP-(fatty) acid ligase